MPEFSNKHIFFDVGHVLVTPSALHALWYIGPQTILKYILYYKKIPARTLLQKRLFDFINYATALPTHASIHSCSCELPQIMYEWIVGKKTTVELLSTINNSPLKDQFFDSAAERDLVLGLTNLFKPEYLIMFIVFTLFNQAFKAQPFLFSAHQGNIKVSIFTFL